MTDDQRRSRGVPEGGTPGLATVHNLFTGRAAGGRPVPKGGSGQRTKPGESPAENTVVGLDGSRLNQHDLRDMIAQKEAEWRSARGEGEFGRRGQGEDKLGRRGEGEFGRRGEGEFGRRGEGEFGRRGEDEGEFGTGHRAENQRGPREASRSSVTHSTANPGAADPDGSAPEIVQPAWSTPDWAGQPAEGDERRRKIRDNAYREGSGEPGSEGTGPGRSGGAGRQPRRKPDGERRRSGLSRKRRDPSQPRAGADENPESEDGRISRPRPPADPELEAREILLKQLSGGDRTRAQLAKVLAEKEIPDEVAAAVLDRFEEVDLVDDVAFSQQYVEHRHAGKGLAKRALAYELRRKGVADETVREAVDQLSPDDELSTARQLVRKKAPSMRNDDPERRLRRLAGMLARKGYGSGTAYQAIREELADLDAEGMFGHPDFD